MENQTTTDGFEHELGFWGWFVGSPRFLINWVRPKQNPEIRANHPDVAKCFDDFAAAEITDHAPIMILDVGSGVLPWIKGILGTKGVIITCDPLAEEYAKIFDYDAHGEDAPVKAFAEACLLTTTVSILCIVAMHSTTRKARTKLSWKWKGFADPVE